MSDSLQMLAQLLPHLSPLATLQQKLSSTRAKTTRTSIQSAEKLTACQPHDLQGFQPVRLAGLG